jgi:hypothetical protein
MARFRIVLKKPSLSGKSASAPRGMNRLKLAGIILSTGLLLIGIVIAVFILGSIIATVVLALLLVAMLTLAVRILVGAPRRP